jgi:AcrR family transcriptional regulator
MAYRRTERTEARLAQARERILAAALGQVAEGGYASASIQAIAARAGVATGSVYRHFPSKAELFAEVFRRQARQELAVLEQIAERDGPALERLAAATEALARRALAAPTLAYAQIAEPVEQEVEAERLVLRRGYRDAFARILSEGIERGDLEPHDTRTYGAAILGAISEALVGPLGDPGVRDSEALVASLVQFTTGGARAPAYGKLQPTTDIEGIVKRAWAQ